MKTNGELFKLLEKKCYNEQDYYDKVTIPFLNILGIPEENRFPQFLIRTFLGDQKTDYLILVGNVPILAVECKHRAKDFESAVQQVRFFSTNFDPKIKEIRKQTVPFQLVLCGNKAQQYKIKISSDGLTPELEPLRGFLEWSDLLKVASPIQEFATLVQRGQVALSLIKEVVAPEVLYTEQASQLLDELYTSLKEPKNLKNPDERVICLNKIIQFSTSNQSLASIFEEYSFGARISRKVESILQVYEFTKLPRPTVAYAYRNFVGRNFTGESFGIRARIDGKLKNVGRYLTPLEVIKFMVDLTGVSDSDRVIDFACGSGGFLGEILGHIDRKGYSPQRFITNNLFACDVDPFSVSTAKTFLTLLYPEHRNQFHIFQHNGLYSKGPRKPQLYEDKETADFIRAKSFDLVISNPPGNKEYSGTNANFVRKIYDISTFFWDVVPFIKRAIELTKPNGKTCLVVPDGLCANNQLQFLRKEIGKVCQVRAVISLPRIFKFNNASMHILYLVKKAQISSDTETFMASIPLEIETEDGEKEIVNINAELNRVLEEYRTTL